LEKKILFLWKKWYTTIKKFRVRDILKEPFIQQGSIKLIQSDSKDIIMKCCQITFMSNKCFSFELSIHQRVF